MICRSFIGRNGWSGSLEVSTKDKYDVYYTNDCNGECESVADMYSDQIKTVCYITQFHMN